MAEPAKKPAPQAPAPQAPANPKESKAARFVRLGEKRVPRALKAISVVRNLAGKASYDYTPEQAKRIVDAITAEVSALRQAFEGRQDILSLFKL